MHKCIYCGKTYPALRDKELCMASHDLIYVPITKEDLMRLNQFLVTGEKKLLTKTLLRTITNYARTRDDRLPILQE